MTHFINATFFTGDTWLTNASVTIDAGRIQTITTDASADQSTAHSIVDLAGDYLLPGLIDLQLYGGSQLFLNDVPTPDTVRHIYDTHVRNGTTTLLPTIHSTSLNIMRESMRAVAAVRDENPFGVPGIHIEGPYFNPIKRGAHSMAYVRTPAEGELETLFSTHADVIRILTLAPEILTPAQLDTINRLKHANTRLSLGHSNATYRQATDAFNAGIPLATHLYNAMRGFESREPGIVGAVFDHNTVRSSIIADGYHCDPTSLRIAYRLLGERLFLISDALFAGVPGLSDPRPNFTLEQFVVHFEPDASEQGPGHAGPGHAGPGHAGPGHAGPGHAGPGHAGPGHAGPGHARPGRYVNDEGNLAGSAISLIDCVRIAVERAHIPLDSALRMATVVPADVLGMGDQLGRIQTGYVANLLRTDSSLRVKGVWTSGEAI